MDWDKKRIAIAVAVAIAVFCILEALGGMDLPMVDANR